MSVKLQKILKVHHFSKINLNTTSVIHAQEKAMIQCYSEVSIDDKHEKEENNHLSFSFHKMPVNISSKFIVYMEKITHQNVSCDILLKKPCIYTQFLSQHWK